MTEPYLDDGDVQFYHGDAISILQGLPAGIAQTCVTSPPYWGLRDYGTGTWLGGDPDCDHAELGPEQIAALTRGSTLAGGPSEDNHDFHRKQFRDICGKCGAQRTDDQLGLEATPTQYVERMVSVFREVRRVLRDDGTLWLNLGDSYSAQGGGKEAGLYEDLRPEGATWQAPRTPPPGLKPKDLAGIPWKVAFALQADGWYLRSDIIWSKPNPMPESVTDRPTKAHEYLFLLTKGPRYFYDADAIREPHQWAHDYPANGRKGVASQRHEQREEAGKLGGGHSYSTAYLNPAGRNRRSVWVIPTEPFPEAHFATYPQALVQPCIQAGTSEWGECVECGAPWKRQTSTEYENPGNRTTNCDRSLERRHETAGFDVRLEKRVKTNGWESSCSCPMQPPNIRPYRFPVRPQLVLDPFIGSGTTALVARKHGRRCIGIDLSESYLAIAAKRTQQLSLLGGAA